MSEREPIRGSAAEGLACPVLNDGAGERITLAHGEGGRAMRRLIADFIRPRLGVAAPQTLEDAVVLPAIVGPPVLTTDGFVVSPWKFPGGNIGCLAVYGAVNDLAVRGAEPIALTLALILEEGLPLTVLGEVLDSAASAARRCGVRVVAGDTKVTPRGATDGIFIVTTALGRLVEPSPGGAGLIRPGDRLLVSGPIGRHGVAVLAAREQLGFCPEPLSDCGPLLPAMNALRAALAIPRAVRDATRGGVAAVLHEWAADCGHTLAIDERQIPVSSEVRGVCELLGLEPLHLANEGTMVLAVPPEDCDAVLQNLREQPGMEKAALIGEVRPRDVVPVVVRRALGREQPLIEPVGAPLPRIC